MALWNGRLIYGVWRDNHSFDKKFKEVHDRRFTLKYWIHLKEHIRKKIAELILSTTELDFFQSWFPARFSFTGHSSILYIPQILWLWALQKNIVSSSISIWPAKISSYCNKPFVKYLLWKVNTKYLPICLRYYNDEIHDYWSKSWFLMKAK